jgi:hypothetical protein
VAPGWICTEPSGDANFCGPIEFSSATAPTTRWPRPGVNLIRGGGDVGSTTIAVDRVSAQSANSSHLADTDYFCCKIEDGIEATMSLLTVAAIDDHRRLSWSWV